jgi:hypothetical protein
MAEAGIKEYGGTQQFEMKSKNLTRGEYGSQSLREIFFRINNGSLFRPSSLEIRDRYPERMPLFYNPDRSDQLLISAEYASLLRELGITYKEEKEFVRKPQSNFPRVPVLNIGSDGEPVFGDGKKQPKIFYDENSSLPRDLRKVSPEVQVKAIKWAIANDTEYSFQSEGKYASFWLRTEQNIKNSEVNFTLTRDYSGFNRFSRRKEAHLSEMLDFLKTYAGVDLHAQEQWVRMHNERHYPHDFGGFPLYRDY